MRRFFLFCIKLPVVKFLFALMLTAISVEIWARPEATDNTHTDSDHNYVDGICTICGKTEPETTWGVAYHEMTKSGTLLEAISDAIEDDNVKYIQLQRNVTTGFDHFIGNSSFTLDLNGYTLNADSRHPALNIGSNSDIKITDNSVNKSGKIVGNDVSPAINVGEESEVTIESGYIVSSKSTALHISEYCSATINGGRFVGGLDNGVILNDGSLLITGGEFMGDDILCSIRTSFLTSSTTISGGIFSVGSRGSILFAGGELNLKDYPTIDSEACTPITDLIIYSTVDSYDVGTETNVLPKNYYFYDRNYKQQKTLGYDMMYTIGSPYINYIISFVADNGTNESMAAGNARIGIPYVLPTCTFTAPKGKKFKAWLIDGIEYQPGDKIYVRTNTTVTAVWVDYKPEITINDGEEFTLENGVEYLSIVYNRRLPKGKFGTIVLPFVPDEATHEKYSFYQLSGCNTGILTFSKVESLEAGVPYLYKLTEAGSEGDAIIASNVLLTSIVQPVIVHDWTMTGTFSKQIIDCSNANDIYYYAYNSANNEINRVAKTLTVNPFRAYFTTELTSNVKQIRILISDDTTGIVDNYEVGTMIYDNVVYDLSGRKVQNPQKGLYIMNGKTFYLP